MVAKVKVALTEGIGVVTIFVGETTVIFVVNL
jgi:hypothetical protein